MYKKVYAYPEIQNCRKVYLLCSIDIIDSTRKKYTEDKWYKEFLNIYGVLFDLINDFSSKYSKELEMKKFNLWKFVGDEILLYAECTSEKHIVYFTKVFRALIAFWNTNKLKTKRPEIKGTVWIAQPNTVDRCFRIEYQLDSFSTDIDDSCIECDNKEDIIDNIKENISVKNIDFLGPSIDCGFRLSKTARKDKIAISVELADVLLRSKDLCNNINFVKKTKRGLKGVLGNEIEYPIFSLSVNKKNLVLENIKELIDNYYNEIEKSNYKEKVKRIDDNTFKKDELKDVFGKPYKYTPEYITNPSIFNKSYIHFQANYKSAYKVYDIETQEFKGKLLNIDDILKNYGNDIPEEKRENFKNYIIRQYNSYLFVKK